MKVSALIVAVVVATVAAVVRVVEADAPRTPYPEDFEGEANIVAAEVEWDAEAVGEGNNGLWRRLTKKRKKKKKAKKEKKEAKKEKKEAKKEKKEKKEKFG